MRSLLTRNGNRGALSHPICSNKTNGSSQFFSPAWHFFIMNVPWGYIRGEKESGRVNERFPSNRRTEAEPSKRIPLFGALKSQPINFCLRGVPTINCTKAAESVWGICPFLSAHAAAALWGNKWRKLMLVFVYFLISYSIGTVCSLPQATTKRPSSFTSDFFFFLSVRFGDGLLKGRLLLLDVFAFQADIC
jgi:hypothetical protein